jgi:HSP20 family protein
MGRKRQSDTGSGDVGLGGMFRSLGGFLDLLSNLAEQAEEGGEIHRSGELGDEKKGIKAVYGFSVRMGGGGKPVVEKFGNIKEDGQGPVVEEAREPMVDVFDEGDHLLVVAELPGVEASDVGFEVKEDVLDLSATRGERKYRKEVLLPAAVSARAATSSYRNGVFEIKLPKVGP